jgi:hypothetical protein
MIRWVIGYLVSVGGGLIFVTLLMRILHCWIKTKAYGRGEKYRETRWKLDISPWFIGVIERVFFTTIVAFDFSATAVAMIGWITVKMLYNWNLLTQRHFSITTRSLAFAGLLGGLTSMLFAVIGGLICKGQIWF